MRKLVIFTIIFLCINCRVFAQIVETSSVAIETWDIANRYFDTEQNDTIIEQYTVLKSDPNSKHGVYKKMNTSELVLEEGEFSNGKKNGLWRVWWTNYPNYLKIEGKYADDIKEGEWNFYSSQLENTFIERITYSDGEKTQALEKFYDNGKPKSKETVTIIDTMRYKNGDCASWYENGAKEFEGKYTFKSDKNQSIKTGKWLYWFDIGQLKLEENYDDEGILNGKSTTFNETGLIEKVELYQAGQVLSTRDKFDFQKHSLDSLLRNVQTYKNDQETIFVEQIGEIIKNYDLYNNAEKGNEKYRNGKMLNKELKMMCDNHDTINQFDKQVKMLHDTISAAFQQAYPPIFTNEIKPVSNRVTKYKEMGKVIPKIDTAKVLCKIFTQFAENLAEFKAQEKFIAEKLPIIEKTYQDSFPLIHKSEISGFKQFVKNYENIGWISAKMDTGRLIINKLNAYQENFIKMKLLDNDINKTLPVLSKLFKENYSPIYKAELVPLQQATEQYRKIATVAQKISEGERINSALKTLQEVSEKFVIQINEINAKLLEFNTKFAEVKANKQLYKKGSNLCEELTDLYKKEKSSINRLVIGDEIIKSFAKLLTYYQKDNTFLNAQLKETKSIEDVKKVLGL